NAIANYVAGIIGSRLGETGPLAIFSGIAITAIVAGVLLLLLSNKLIDWMHGAEGHKKEEEVEVKTANA
ncbi:dipeptide/tripeptide permease, partial [Photobacterium damselae subsp. damselae]|nr:dipeptide/tripeptide permease [Photobacterium damselae subsp. damselae]